MASKINMYRLYDEEFEEVLHPIIDTEFYYEEDGVTYHLKETQDFEKKTFLNNADESWNYSLNGFGISVKFIFENPITLFGPTQLVNSDGELGIALQWASRQSSQQGIIPIDVLSRKSSANTVIQFQHYFPKDLLFGEVQLSLILYLKKGSVAPGSGQAQISGTILGCFDEWDIVIDGNGSSFPIVIVNEPEKPLWYVDFNYSEPLIEPFDKEYIAIYLNRAHSAYLAVQNPTNAVEETLYVSFLAGALQLILQNLMQTTDWQDIHEGKNCEEGSIGQVMHYFLKTFDWDFDTPEKLAMSLQKDLEKRIKAGGI